jgi:hypothetical protein
MAPPPTMSQPSSQKLGVVPRTCYNYGHVGRFVKEFTTSSQIDAPQPHSHSSHPRRAIAAKTG